MRAMLTVTLAAAAIFGVSASPGLSLSLITPESVTAIVKNTGTETVKLLKDPRGVLSAARRHTFNVATGSPEATVKKNNAASFTTLAPGQTFEITHNLGGIYNFNNTGAGNFKLDAVSNVFQYINASGNLATIEASTESKNVGLTVESSHSLARIYLCGSFWSPATTGTDSQAGTIVHELSHFTVNGGTEDHVYSQTLAKKLAKSNPRPGHHERR
ncbi:unnamed protein product [Rhizoctonia solani]|uniref:Lysine-specific metallo-endopeptidase domain-containing protein n=1 Tax=Rhizoctonia solani TaxID=456999 RepID=A0A8H3CU49_9AGAM|nr:unnamed protein product [Rhizoctonia solani]